MSRSRQAQCILLASVSFSCAAGDRSLGPEAGHAIVECLGEDSEQARVDRSIEVTAHRAGESTVRVVLTLPDDETLEARTFASGCVRFELAETLADYQLEVRYERDGLPDFVVTHARQWQARVRVERSFSFAYSSRPLSARARVRVPGLDEWRTPGRAARVIVSELTVGPDDRPEYILDPEQPTGHQIDLGPEDLQDEVELTVGAFGFDAARFIAVLWVEGPNGELEPTAIGLSEPANLEPGTSVDLDLSLTHGFAEELVFPKPTQSAPRIEPYVVVGDTMAPLGVATPIPELPVTANHRVRFPDHPEIASALRLTLFDPESGGSWVTFRLGPEYPPVDLPPAAGDLTFEAGAAALRAPAGLVCSLRMRDREIRAVLWSAFFVGAEPPVRLTPPDGLSATDEFAWDLRCGTPAQASAELPDLGSFARVVERTWVDRSWTPRG